ncbi:hypothetical protein FRUB_01590 [Fimbriiglobus ruber]|uniref:Uncharacterized protein n=1 Tax=Fimbriiglobus ruber TaxID=1908690 RepID=A0A225E6X7_9BACT|nr:hypothetical protein FRUB_01590 [Fimbriiglobus ruber]
MTRRCVRFIPTAMQNSPRRQDGIRILLPLKSASRSRYMSPVG